MAIKKLTPALITGMELDDIKKHILILKRSMTVTRSMLQDPRFRRTDGKRLLALLEEDQANIKLLRQQEQNIEQP